MHDRMSDDENERFLRIIRELAPLVPQRTLIDVENEIAQVRDARRAGGRGTPARS